MGSKKWFQSKGIYPYDMQPQMKPQGYFFEVPGTGDETAAAQDIILCAKGVFVYISLKENEPTVDEKEKIKNIRESRGSATFLYLSGYERFQEDLLEMLEMLNYDGCVALLDEFY